MKDKCKQKRYVCCHCKKDVNKLTKQDQQMLEEFDKIFTLNQSVYDKRCGRLSLKKTDDIKSFLLKHTARARREEGEKMKLMFGISVTNGSDRPKEEK